MFSKNSTQSQILTTQALTFSEDESQLLAAIHFYFFSTENMLVVSGLLVVPGFSHSHQLTTNNYQLRNRERLLVVSLRGLLLFIFNIFFSTEKLLVVVLN